MKVVCVDDERIALESLIINMKKVPSISETFGFRNATDCLEFFKENTADIAFLDINLGGMNGLELARRVKKLSPSTYIIFVTGYSEYAIDAFKLHVAGYLMKPASVEDIEKEIRNIYNLKPAEHKKRVRIQTFGNFEVFANNKPVPFSRSKAKEVLAFLVDKNGALTTPEQLATILWDDGLYDRSRQKQVQTIISDLIKGLTAVGAENIIIRSSNGIQIDKDAVDCDLFSFFNGDPVAVNSYLGIYMNTYSWAEYTGGFLR